MDHWQPFLVVNLCHSLIEYYTISNGKWIWLLRYMTKIHQNERKKSPFAHLTHQALSAISNATLKACMSWGLLE